MIRPAFPKTGVPVGRQIASKIPWWSSSKVNIVDASSGGGSEFPIPGQANREIFARNQYAWPLHITEIRMWTTPITLDTGRSSYWNSMKKTAFKFKSSRHGYLNSKWLPGMCFNTETDRHLMGYQNGIVFTLPADMYLSVGQTPLVEMHALNTNLDSRYIQTAMRGYDPTTDSPIVVNGRLDTVGTAATQAIVFAYDDERDQSVRDMWVRDFTFCTVSHDSTGYSRDPWANISARFFMAEGPHWCMEEITPFTGLADQVPAFNLGDENSYETYYPDPPVIYKPVVPFVLLPGDLFTVEAKLLDSTFWNLSSESIDLWVHFRGYQEGTYHAS